VTVFSENRNPFVTDVTFPLAGEFPLKKEPLDGITNPEGQMTGFIVIDKPKDITSFAAVARVRRITGEKKAGHTGTLDPMATGVLPVMLGGATRFAELIPSHDKGYRATIKLGITTDTLDITGKTLSTGIVTATAADFEETLKRFTGVINQTPPMYSALSKDGVRLYELARKGVEIERETRSVEIYAANLLTYNEEDHTFEVDVKCSAGTYIRSLAADIGAVLRCGAVLSGLRRTLANGFTLENCVTPGELEQAAQAGEIEKHLIGVDKVLGSYPAVEVTPAQSVRFRNGGALDLARIKQQASFGYFRVYSEQNVFLGIGEIRHGGEEMTVKRVFLPAGG
jgi:tRNA pseudouridine55 synthase